MKVDLRIFTVAHETICHCKPYHVSQTMSEVQRQLPASGLVLRVLELAAYLILTLACLSVTLE